jgi:hypothetical protein
MSKITNQQKEGIIIFVTFALLSLAAIVFSDWSETTSLRNAEVGPEWLKYKVGSGYNTYDKYVTRFDLINVLLIFGSVMTYGALRAAKIVKRLFKFERHISSLVASEE